MPTQTTSYSQILKSSSIVGGAQLIRMLFGVVQTKFAAILLGPTGIGLIGAFQSIIQLAGQLSGLGIKQSGVRDVAVAAGTDQQHVVDRTITILRRMCWLTGLFGSVGMAALALPVSQLTFGDSTHVLGLMLLSFVVLITAITQGQMAIIQGLRRIADLVRVQMWGSFVGAIASVALYATLGVSSVVPSLLACSLINLGAAWFYSRKILPKSISMSWYETFVGAKKLVGLGTAFMLGGLATTFTAYATRALIVRDIGLDELGMYQAAFSISGYVLNFVIGAMGADFYPRLAGAAANFEKMTLLVNEQTEIGLLLATPALIAILGLAPLAINLLYSTEFSPAVELLRWFAIGCFLQVISWPMGYVQMAVGAKWWFVFSQIFFSVLHLILIIVGMSFFGVRGAAIAFFLMYAIHVLGIWLIARHLINFTWSRATKKLIFTQVTIVISIFVATITLPEFWGVTIGAVMFLAMGVFCLRQLLVRLGPDHKITKVLRKLLLKRVL